MVRTEAVRWRLGQNARLMERLFIYGSLQPGGPNERVLAGIEGEWERAVIKGKLVEDGWGADLGYPALVIDDQGDEIAGYVFTSERLSAAWTDLDEFEGEQYERVVATVTLEDGTRVRAHVYVLQRR